MDLDFADKETERLIEGVQLPTLFGWEEGIDIAPGREGFPGQGLLLLRSMWKGWRSGHANYNGQGMQAVETLPGAGSGALGYKDWILRWGVGGVRRTGGRPPRRGPPLPVLGEGFLGGGGHSGDIR